MGVLTNPSAVEARIKQPDGTTITATPTGVSTGVSTGVYTYDFTPTLTGVHSYAMQGTSGLIVADGGEFTVYPLEA